jgi:hypothetical protein
MLELVIPFSEAPQPLSFRILSYYYTNVYTFRNYLQICFQPNWSEFYRVTLIPPLGIFADPMVSQRMLQLERSLTMTLNFLLFCCSDYL